MFRPFAFSCVSVRRVKGSLLAERSAAKPLTRIDLCTMDRGRIDKRRIRACRRFAILTLLFSHHDAASFTLWLYFQLRAMKDTQLYAQLLGLSKPWSVSQVDVDLAGYQITVRVECGAGEVWICPDTKTRAHIHGWVERSWRHLDTCQFETRIVAKIPRLKYSDGRVEDLPVPWAERYSRITLLLEAFVLRLLQAAASIQRVSELIRMDWHTINTVMKRGVERGMARREDAPIQHLGLDEKSFGRGHNYVSILTEIGSAEGGQSGARVLDVVPERTLVAAKTLLETLTQAQRDGVQAIAMDMWPAYRSAATKMLENAQVVHDKFHIAKYLNEAVDAVRRAEHKKLLGVGDDRLTGSKYAWLKSAPDLRTCAGREFKPLYQANLKTSRAWALKESFAAFWDYRSPTHARNYFEQWGKRTMRSRLEPLKKVTKMLRRHEDGLMNFITHRITNAAAEGFNSVVQTIKANARGFRSFANYRIRILFYCGKLDVMPAR